MSLVQLLLLIKYKSPLAGAVTGSWILDQDPQNPLAMRGFPAARALPLCPDALFLQECRYLHGEFQGPACGRDGPYAPDVFFWCCILFFATFALSSFLKKFKTSRYFPTRVGRRWWPASISTLVSQNGFPGALSGICHPVVKLGNVGLAGQALQELGCPALISMSAKSS